MFKEKLTSLLTTNKIILKKTCLLLLLVSCYIICIINIYNKFIMNEILISFLISVQN